MSALGSAILIGRRALLGPALPRNNVRAMGHVYASVKFANPRDIEEGRREKMVEERALIDTGATFTTVPRSLAKKLALPIMGKVKVRTASGEESLDQSYAYTEASGKSTVAPMLVSDKMDKTLLGVFTLEALGLTVDISTGKLKEAEVLLL